MIVLDDVHMEGDDDAQSVSLLVTSQSLTDGEWRRIAKIPLYYREVVMRRTELMRVKDFRYVPQRTNCNYPSRSTNE